MADGDICLWFTDINFYQNHVFKLSQFKKKCAVCTKNWNSNNRNCKLFVLGINIAHMNEFKMCTFLIRSTLIYRNVDSFLIPNIRWVSPKKVEWEENFLLNTPVLSLTRGKLNAVCLRTCLGWEWANSYYGIFLNKCTSICRYDVTHLSNNINWNTFKKFGTSTYNFIMSYRKIVFIHQLSWEIS